MRVTTGPSRSAASIRSTSPGTGWMIIRTSAPKRSSSEAKRSDSLTAAGTIAPTIPVLVALTAGLIPGSIPTTGIVRVPRSASAEPAVPVLDPMTMALMPCVSRNRAIARPRSRTNSGGLSPQGAFAESAT